EEDPVVQERAAEVVGREEDEHGRAPDHEQRTPVLQASLREDLALLLEIAGEEDDQRDLAQLTGLQAERTEMDPQPRAVDRHGDPSDDVREEEEREEERRVRERRSGDRRLARDVDAREADRGENADHPEREQLPVSQPDPSQRNSPQTTSAAATTSRNSIVTT